MNSSRAKWSALFCLLLGITIIVSVSARSEPVETVLTKDPKTWPECKPGEKMGQDFMIEYALAVRFDERRILDANTNQTRIERGGFVRLHLNSLTYARFFHESRPSETVIPDGTVLPLEMLSGGILKAKGLEMDATPLFFEKNAFGLGHIVIDSMPDSHLRVGRAEKLLKATLLCAKYFDLNQLEDKKAMILPNLSGPNAGAQFIELIDVFHKH